MYFQEFYYWCRDAVRKIKFIPDRNKVYEELRGHMEDRYQSLLERGISPKDAEKQTLAAMGDANEIADQLAAIHRPFWGYALLITRFLAAVLFFLAIGNGIYYFHEEHYLQGKELNTFNMASGEYYCYVQPETTDRSDGYTFRVTDAALWRNTIPAIVDGGLTYYDRLFLRLEVHNPLPWALEQNALEHMWAIDSAGNYYDRALYETTETGERYYNIGEQRLSATTYRYDLCVNDPPEDIQWFELHYDRDGRDLVLRVNLREEG